MVGRSVGVKETSSRKLTPTANRCARSRRSFGSVESVKAASDVYSPVSGVVTEVNEVLSDEPGTVNTAAESEGWFIKVEMSDTSEVRER